MHVFAAYQWWISKHQPGDHPYHPDNMFGFLAVDNRAAASLLFAAVADLSAKHKRADGPANKSAAVRAVLEHGPGDNVASSAQLQVSTLRRTWSKATVKVVCMQDEIADSYDIARPLVDNVVREFLQTRYAQPSRYELHDGGSNGCRYVPRSILGAA